jgi:uncharacterized protein (DUF924 family)
LSTTIEEVVTFWQDAGPERWFEKDAVFDAEFAGRFMQAHHAAARRELDGWAETAEGSFALMILLDQLPRNCFRGTAHMYATDPLARHFARHALAAGQDRAFEGEIRVFFYLPFMHSEDMADQDLSAALCDPLENAREHGHGHRDIIARFGRFPHRNRMLARETTPQEQAFMDEGGFAG